MSLFKIGIRPKSDRNTFTPLPTDPTVKLVDASVEYQSRAGAVTALSKIDLVVMPGEAVVLTGPSGSGKSTLLRLLGRVEKPTSGTASFPRGGSAMSVFQDHLLVPFLTVQENLRLAAELHSPIAASREDVMNHLEMVGLESFGDRLPPELSGGERQRVAVAQSLITRPALLLADEPTGSLDENNSASLAALLVSITKAAGSETAVVVATHSEVVASAFDIRWRIASGVLTC